MRISAWGRHEPTQHTPNGVGFWVVSRYDDVVAVFKDAETFSSELGGTQIYDGKGMGYQLDQTDDPNHRRLRALVNKGFTPRMIGRLDDRLPQLSNMELRAFFNLLFPAGAETTRSAIGGGLLALTENPDEMKRLRENPTLIKTAIEEIVRWTSASVYKRRTASRDTELRGIPIRKGHG